MMMKNAGTAGDGDGDDDDNRQVGAFAFADLPLGVEGLRSAEAK